MIQIGQHHDLTILRETSVGLFLGSEDEDVLLPKKYIPEEFKIGDVLKVFVYRDFEERKVAVTIEPKIKLLEFAYLKVFDVSDIGAFLEWGMEKHLMVPFKEQQHRMVAGNSYVVYMDIDKKTDRLYASSKIDKFLKAIKPPLEEGDEVEILVYHKSDLGYSVIVNKQYKGMVFSNQVFSNLNTGDILKAYVKNIRPDNKLDISLQPIGYRKYNDPNTEKLFRTLQKHDGFLPVNDDSSPEEIYKLLGMSKKAFKKSAGALYKRKKISFESGGIRFKREA